jgi:creatinine amidohydrolase
MRLDQNDELQKNSQMASGNDYIPKLGPNAYWGDLTTNSFGSMDPNLTVAILPVAAIEQHGPHLPLNTDAEICEGLVKRVVNNTNDRLQIIALPLMQIGESSEHQDFPGTLGVNAEQLISLWTTLGKQVFKAGMRKLLILNTHGGQLSIVDIVAQRLRAENEMLVVSVSSFRLGVPDGLFDRKEIEDGIHAGEIETSMMLYLKPDKVRMDQAEDFKSASPVMQKKYRHLALGGMARIAWQAQDLNVKGAVGQASKADPKRGGILVQHLVDGILEVLDDMACFPVSSLSNGC